MWHRVRVLRARPRPRLALAVAAIFVAGIAIGVLLSRGDEPPPLAPARGPAGDPLAWRPGQDATFEQRAASGESHVLFAKSPGGVAATARRVERWRPLVAASAARHGVSPDDLEALVFLESAGRSDAIASATEGAVGLTQILAETGQNLLGMKVDVPRSRRYSRRIRRELLRGRLLKVQKLQRARARVDQRFDPTQALMATARYLKMAKDRFDREDMAFVSYHMGMGNLEGVLRAYGDDDVPYTQVYFDSTPTRHAAAYAKLATFGDDSSNYWWKLGAAERIMELSRKDAGKLAALQAAQTAKNSAEEVLHPPAATERFATPEQLRAAWDDEKLVAFPRDERVSGLRADPRMGELGKPRSLYEGLRPEALATALYIGAQVRALSGQSPLAVTSTVRDDAYQRRLVARNGEATRGYSLHTTGWAFDIARRYRSKAHARAFQFVLDRLQVLDAIAWVREPGAIHITASGEDVLQ
jgi:hypothetical protein